MKFTHGIFACEVGLVVTATVERSFSAIKIVKNKREIK